jgi:CBS domain-containing protein
MKSTVKEVLNRKGSNVVTVDPGMTVFKALQIMADKNIGAVVVVKKDKVVGIFSERDYARKIVLKGKSSKKTAVNDIVSTKVLYVTPETSIEDCMALMTTKRVRHLPVLDEGKLAGIISIGDVVNKIITDQKFMINQLERYITGEY